MSLIFYYAPMSTASLTEIVLAELGVPCERVTLDLKRGDARTPDYLKVNPNGKVPCIVHDGTPVWESAAITMYLGELFGVEKQLYPAPGPRRGEAMKWITWSNVTLAEAFSRYSRNTMDWTPADQRNAKAAEVAKKELDRCVRILDQHLEGRDYLAGEYTLADTHVHATVNWLRQMKAADVDANARIKAWCERCAARPAFRKVMASGQ